MSTSNVDSGGRKGTFLSEDSVKEETVAQSSAYLSLQDISSSVNAEDSQDIGEFFKEESKKSVIKYELFLNDNESDDETENSESDSDSIESMSYIKEIISLTRMSLPLSIGNFARLAMYNIDSIFLGHLGTDELAGVALCMILMEIITMFVYSPAWSLNGLCSQAIGAGNPTLAGNWLQLSIGYCTIISLPSLIVYWYIADIIGIFENDNNVVYYARIFSHYASSWLLLSAINMAIRGYLQSIEVILPLTIVPIITITFDAAMNYFLIYGITINIFNINIDWNGLGFIGSPLATLSSVLLQLILFYMWCFMYKKHHIKKNAWSKWSLKSFEISRIKRFSKIMVCNCFWTYF